MNRTKATRGVVLQHRPFKKTYKRRYPLLLLLSLPFLEPAKFLFSFFLSFLFLFSCFIPFINIFVFLFSSQFLNKSLSHPPSFNLLFFFEISFSKSYKIKKKATYVWFYVKSTRTVKAKVSTWLENKICISYSRGGVVHGSSIPKSC